jgi:hypothetical protein
MLMSKAVTISSMRNEGEDNLGEWDGPCNMKMGLRVASSTGNLQAI